MICTAIANLERFYQHMEQMMLNSGFIREANPGQVMSKLRRLMPRRMLSSSRSGRARV
jgi:tRNA C32,U32 (ribose-2'-O)-methylase TrmJ